MQVLDNPGENEQRPEAAFLLPPDPTDPFSFSAAYLGSREELFAEGFGVVYGDQVLFVEGTRVDTLIFDAKDCKNGNYLWQLSQALPDLTHVITQLSVSEDGPVGRVYNLDSQYGLRSTHEFSPDETAEFWRTVTVLLATQEAVALEGQLRIDKEEAKLAEEAFIQSRREATETREDTWIELTNRAFVKQLEQLTKIAKSIGFTSLTTFTPTICTPLENPVYIWERNKADATTESA